MQTLPPSIHPGERIEVLPAFRRVNAHLLELLESLAPSDWTRPTVHKTRDVKDLVAHLVDGSMRRLSLQRDGWSGEKPRGIDSWQGLVDFIQAMNREWMTVARRLSPRILIDLARRYDSELVSLLEGIAPEAPALFSVAWAGEASSLHWFDLAREYTEKWHHQQQLRDATGRPPLYAPDLLAPVLETFARGLPHALRDAAALEGAAVSVQVVGPVELGWTLCRSGGAWLLHRGVDPDADAALTLEADHAWRLWTKGLSAEEARAAVHTQGEAALTAPLLHFTAIMA